MNEWDIAVPFALVVLFGFIGVTIYEILFCIGLILNERKTIPNGSEYLIDENAQRLTK